MKKIILITLLSLFILYSANANFEEDSISNFVNSPSFEDLEKIKDPITRFCEETYLKAYMRREFSELENIICSDFFAKKQEEEFLYKSYFSNERGIY